jgi:hypothetical protein
MRAIRLAAMSLAAVLVLSACVTGPFSLADDFDLPTIDLSESDDPTVRASSEAWEATVATQDAEDKLAVGIANDDLQAIRDAAKLRPEDPRYPIFEDLLTNGQSLDDLCDIDPNTGGCAANPSVNDTKRAAISKAQELIRAQNPGKPETEIKRIWVEMRVNAMLEVIKTKPDDPLREARVDVYCWNVDFYDLPADTSVRCPPPPPEPAGSGGNPRGPGDKAEPEPSWEDLDPTETESGIGTTG